jgi:hypothetical protein
MQKGSVSSNVLPTTSGSPSDTMTHQKNEILKSKIEKKDNIFQNLFFSQKS